MIWPFTQYVYMETSPNSKLFHCRGKVGERDNPKEFARLMARHRLRVVTTRRYLGNEVTLAKLEGGK